MEAYRNLNKPALEQELNIVKESLAQWRAKDLHLNMARGKPGKDQLDMVSGILTVLNRPEQCVSDGIDARNYGELTRPARCAPVLGRHAGLQTRRDHCGRQCQPDPDV